MVLQEKVLQVPSEWVSELYQEISPLVKLFICNAFFTRISRRASSISDVFILLPKILAMIDSIQEKGIFSKYISSLKVLSSQYKTSQDEDSRLEVATQIKDNLRVIISLIVNSDSESVNGRKITILNKIALPVDNLPKSYLKIITYMEGASIIKPTSTLIPFNLGFEMDDPLKTASFIDSENGNYYLSINIQSSIQAISDLYHNKDMFEILKILILRIKASIEHELTHYIQLTLLTFLSPDKDQYYRNKIKFPYTQNEDFWESYISHPYELKALEISCAYDIYESWIFSDSKNMAEYYRLYLKTYPLFIALKKKGNITNYEKAIKNVWHKLITLDAQSPREE